MPFSTLEASLLGSDFLTSLWKFLSSTPLGNICSILGFLIAIGPTIRWYMHRAFKDKDYQISELTEQRDRQNKTIDNTRAALKASEERCLTFKARLPETAFYAVKEQLDESNYDRANLVALFWARQEGKPLSDMFLRRAEWAVSHAVTDLRAKYLVVAQAYAISAVAIAPQNENAFNLLNDLEALLDKEGHSLPPLGEALIAIEGFAESENDPALERFNDTLAEAALETIQEAQRQYDAYHCHSAWALAKRAELLWLQTIGKTAIPTFLTQRLKASILERLGRLEESLLIARNLADAMAASLGLLHTETLKTRNRVAWLLKCLHRDEEAFALAQDINTPMMNDPALGPTNNCTLLNRGALVLLLNNLGRWEEAITMGRDIAKDMKNSTEYGPSDPQTIYADLLVCLLLIDKADKPDEALPILRDVAQLMVADPDLGRSNPKASNARLLASMLMDKIDHSIRSSLIADEVSSPARAPESEPLHPKNLQWRYSRALILGFFGNFNEAFPLMRDVANDMEHHPEMGLAHLDTVEARRLASCFRAKIDDFNAPHKPL